MSPKTIYFLNILFIVFCTVILVSNIFLEKFSLFIFLILTIGYIVILVHLKIKNVFYYFFVLSGFFISFIITKVQFFESVILLISFSIIILVYSFILRTKGIEGTVVDCGETYSIVEVKPDVITTIKPGYYIVEEKLKKGTKIRIKEVDFFKNAKIKKYSK